MLYVCKEQTIRYTGIKYRPMRKESTFYNLMYYEEQYYVLCDEHVHMFLLIHIES